jgi:stage II sporulation protein D
MRFATVLFCLVAMQMLSAQTMQISIFNNFDIKAFTVSVQQGKYQLECDNEKYGDYKKNSIFFISRKDDKIEIRDKNSVIGVFSEINLAPTDKECIIMVKGVNPATVSQTYDDAVLFKVSDSKLLAINNVDLEKYIAGVIEAEGGIDAPLEYYKAQAVLVRTYTIKNIYKHAEEGFNLCDQVHCQAYMGRSARNLLIYDATQKTAGMVLIDKDSILAMTPFFSSCGGQTSSAGIYWQSDLPYLQSINDPFCKEQKNSTWEQRIPFSEWKLFLTESGIKQPEKYVSYTALNREQYFINNKTKVAFRQIREKFVLKSSFFSISQQGGEIVFNGKGYGHGIGMCQIGAMEMAKVGYSFIDIIHFYFQNVKTTDYREMELHRY